MYAGGIIRIKMRKSYTFYRVTAQRIICMQEGRMCYLRPSSTAARHCRAVLCK